MFRVRVRVRIWVRVRSRVRVAHLVARHTGEAAPRLDGILVRARG